MRAGGFVLTLDVILALIVGSFLVFSIMYLLTQPKANTFDYMYRVGLDVLAVSEKDGSLREAAGGEPDGLNGFIYSMPETLCMNVTIYDNESAVVYTNSTANCAPPVTYVVSWRSFIDGTDFYLASAGVWPK